MMDTPLSPRLPPGRRVYAIGDAHGHRERLDRAHARIRADLRDRPVDKPLLVHLGDLVDRGPDSAGCLAALAGGPPIPGVPTVNLMGNHERMMLDALAPKRHDAVDLWLDNGGAETLRSLGLRSTQRPADWLEAIPAALLVFLQHLRLSHVQDGYAFVHAGVRPGVELARQREADLLWIRDSFLHWDGVMLPEAPERVIVHGHTPVERAELRPNRIGLDTGAGRGGPLTCAVLEGDGIGLFQS